jgi:RiboL-PSP-HEPN
VASPALTSLRGSRLAEVRALLRLRPERVPGDRASVAAADAVNRASVVVLVAHVEGFIEDLIDDAIDLINSNTPATADVPLELLAMQVAPELNMIAQMQDVSKRASRTRDLFIAHAPLWLDANLAPGRLSAETIAANLDNPGAKQVARVLGFLGMSDVFANVQLPDAADPAKRLNEMVGVRNSIAHGGSPSVGDDQALAYVDSVEAIGDGLEHEVARHVQVLCRLQALPWP